MLLFFKNFDWRLNSALFVLMAASLVSLASTDQALFTKQFLWYGIGFLLVLFIIRLDWRIFINYPGFIYGIYGLAVLLLAATFFFGTEIRGAQSWLLFGGFQLQPAELAKVALIIILADFFRRKHVRIALVRTIGASFLYFVLPAAFVAFQPDFGSLLVLFSLWFGFLLVSGIAWRHLLVAVLIFAVLGGFMWFNVLEQYQKDRIAGLFFPDRDPRGVNYSAIQSKIAIGSAGMFGKGFGQGTQTQLGFLPEAQTDFIFAAFVEEWGLLLGAFVLFVFAYLVFRIIRIGLLAETNFSRFVCLGTAILFVVQFILNVGSNLALTPVIGVTFPFFSYGGSSVLTNFILIGIIHSVALRRSFS